MAIPSVPSCNSDESCEGLPLVELGRGLVVIDPTSQCQSVLEGAGIPVQEGSEVRNRDGSALDPIKIPKLQTHEGSFPLILIMNKAGVLMALQANKEDKRYILTSKNGSFHLEEALNEPCFKDEDICDDCEPQHIAGFRVVNGKACLIKLPLSITTDFWASSDCIEITGSGTEEDPYVASIKISDEDDNIIQCLPDGLFAAAPSS